MADENKVKMTPEMLEERLIDLAVRVISLANRLAPSFAGKHIANQIVRSGTSPAPNYAEARSAESRADFIHKPRIVVKELNETSVWLRITAKSSLVKPELLSGLHAVLWLPSAQLWLRLSKDERRRRRRRAAAVVVRVQFGSAGPAVVSSRQQSAWQSRGALLDCNKTMLQRGPKGKAGPGAGQVMLRLLVPENSIWLLSVRPAAAASKAAAQRPAAAC